MKKNHLLKLATIIAFVVFAIHEIGPSMYAGMIDGLHSADNYSRDKRGWDVLIDGNTLLHETGGTIKLDSAHTLHDIIINARLNSVGDDLPVIFTLLHFALVAGVVYITWGILNRLYKIITAISNNRAFEQTVIENINQIGYYFLSGFVLLAAFEKLLIEETKLMAGPRLHLAMPMDWHLEFLVAGLLVLLFAGAFEQGMALKKEQDLTI